MNSWDVDVLTLSHRPMGRGYTLRLNMRPNNPRIWSSRQTRLFDTLFRRIRFRLGATEQKERDGWAYNILYTIDRYLDLCPEVPIRYDEEGHCPGCVCADCSGAELTADND